MTNDPQDIDDTFTAPMGVTVKGEVWACVEMPNSAEFFGAGNRFVLTQPWTTSRSRTWE